MGPCESKSPEETLRLGEELGTLLREGDVVSLCGDLGAGKTTFVTGMAKGLGMAPEYAVTSPTFVFVQIYPGRIPLYHVDLYRVESESALSGLGLSDLFGEEGVAVVEWFDRFPGVWPGERVDIRFRYRENGARDLEIRGMGERGREIVEAWEAKRSD